MYKGLSLIVGINKNNNLVLFIYLVGETTLSNSLFLS